MSRGAPTLRKRVRFVDRERDDPEWKAVHRAADRNLVRVSAAFTGSLYVLRSEVDQAALELALQRNDPGMAVTAFPWDLWARSFDRLVTPRIGETMRASAEAVGRKTVLPAVQKKGTLQGIFDLLNPRAQRIASEIAGKLVTRVSDATKWAVRQVITRAQGSGTSLRDQARELRDILVESAGLDGPRADRLDKFRRTLQAQGLPERTIRQRVEEMRDRLLMERAKTIARTETHDAAVAGQVELWDQAREQELLPATIQVEWLDTDDGRECPICNSLDGQRVPKGELFRSDYTGLTYARPPAHPQCRCVLILVDPEEE